MKDLVRVIIEPLVDSPADIDIREVESDGATTLELRVKESDLGKVIGKQGRTAKAIRTILGAAGAKSGKRFLLEIID